jgi:acetylornithine deacetylase/succinyl-diaminopimelate desuccinylase-like protein
MDLVRELDALAPGLAEYDVVHEEPAVPADPDMALVPMLESIVRERHPGSAAFPLLLPGYTDARYLSRLGIQTYGFLPLKVERGFPGGLIHAPNERVPIGAVRFGADCVYEAICRYRG